MEFIPPCEKGISDFDIINEKLLFICDKEIKSQKITKFEPCLEKIVLFHCSNDKLIQKESTNTNNANQVQNTKTSQTQEINIEVFNLDQIEQYKNR